jgi:hypothetical protein
MDRIWKSKWLVALGCLAVFTMAMAAEQAPSGTIKLTSKSVAVGIGVTWGDGTLTFDGKPYAFSVEGLSVVDLGVSDVTTSGEVFNLKNVADLSGTYASAEIGAAIVKGENDTIMKNEKGVVLRLHGTQKGARLTLGPGGVKLKLKS